jgi:hypothetical protein
MPRVHVLDVELLDVRPRIWRRVRVPADLSLFELHQVIQLLMGWHDHHLHVFEIGNQEYGPRPDEELESEAWAGEDADITVAKALERAGGVIRYVYDFGSEWRVAIVPSADQSAAGPATVECLAAELAGPPEDSGGPAAYQQLLDIWTRRGRRGVPHEQRLWLPDNFDPMRTDLAAINARLSAAATEAAPPTAAPPQFASAEEQLAADITLVLLLLGSWEERNGIRMAWKTTPFEVLDVLKKAGLIDTTPARKSLILTESGIRRAEALRDRVAALLRDG